MNTTNIPTNIQEFVKWCKNHPNVYFFTLDGKDWDIANLWRKTLIDNTDTSLAIKKTNSFLLVYNHAIKLFGTDNFNKDLQQMFDDNKSDIFL